MGLPNEAHRVLGYLPGLLASQPWSQATSSMYIVPATLSHKQWQMSLSCKLPPWPMHCVINGNLSWLTNRQYTAPLCLIHNHSQLIPL